LNLASFIAKRYLFSKTNRNAVNLISWISVIAITVVSAAMFIVLSGFNGIGEFVKNMYSEFDSELKIVHQSQKFFPFESQLQKSLEHSNVAHYSKILEDRCLFLSGDKNEFGIIKGVDSNFTNVSRLPSKKFDGDFLEFNNQLPHVFLGESLRSKLAVGVGNTYSHVEVWVPKPNKKISLDITKDFRSQKFFTIGSFSVSPEYDPIYGLTNIKYAQKLFDTKNKVSAIELRVKEKNDLYSTKDALSEQLEPLGLKVLDINEQHADFLKFVDLEKYFVIFIFILIILLAAFNLIGTLSILIIEKKNNLKTILYLGGSPKLLRQIFWNLNYLMNIIGVVCGLILGFIVCYIQQTYQPILMVEGINSIAYPIDMQFKDVLTLIVLVFSISTICSFFSIRKIKIEVL